MRWPCYKHEGISATIVFNWTGWLTLGGREGQGKVEGWLMSLSAAALEAQEQESRLSKWRISFP